MEVFTYKDRMSHVKNFTFNKHFTKMVISKTFLPKYKFNFYKSRVAKMNVSLNLAVLLILLAFANTDFRILFEYNFIQLMILFN